MKDSKQEIISDLKNKLNEFKSKFKERKTQNNIDDDIENLEININTLKNYYKSQEKDNKNNIANAEYFMTEELEGIVITFQNELTEIYLRNLDEEIKDPEISEKYTLTLSIAVSEIGETYFEKYKQAKVYNIVKKLLKPIL